MFPIKTKMLTPNKYSRPQTRMQQVKGVIIHWTANESRGADAYANINYFENRKYGKTGYGSAHYFVDSEQIVQCLPDSELGYHVGATSYKTNKYGSYPNNSTIGVEMCVNADGNFATVYAQTVQLTAHLLKRYSLNPDIALDRHFDITGKNCPAMFTSNHWGKTNNGYAVKYGMGSNANVAWKTFKQQVKKAMSGAVTQASATPPVSGSVVDYLIGLGRPSAIGDRAKLAAQYGIADYAGSEAQNLQLLAKLQAGPAKPKPAPKPAKTAAAKPKEALPVSDIKGHWAEKDILSLNEKGIMMGNEKGDFNPNEQATRAQLAAMLNRTIDYIDNNIGVKK